MRKYCLISNFYYRGRGSSHMRCVKSKYRDQTAEAMIDVSYSYTALSTSCREVASEFGNLSSQFFLLIAMILFRSLPAAFLLEVELLS